MPAPGTGASLLTSATAQVITGAPAGILTEARDDEEWRKRITSILRPAPAVVFDNLTGKLNAGSLAAALTTTVWEDRALGGNDVVRIPVKCTWLSTGNNVQLGGDFIRRVVPIALDAPEPRGIPLPPPRPPAMD